MKFYIAAVLLVVSLPFKSFADDPLTLPQIDILWGEFTRPASLFLINSELEKSIHVPVNGVPGAKSTHGNYINFANLKTSNPFFVTHDAPHEGDFYVGTYLPNANEKKGPIPTVPEKDAQWFDKLIAAKHSPKVFIIGGHQVISEGWHNDAESDFMFLPTLMKTISNNPAARRVFEGIKIAVLFGCNTMTNLEPHADDGHLMSSNEIKNLYFSGPAGKQRVLGGYNDAQVNTLDFYRGRLANEYGPNSDHYEYTRATGDPEKCSGPGPYDHCGLTNLDRIMPDSGLWDQTHRYNYPYMMRRIFPNANIILGFSSASPSEEERVKILKTAIDGTYADVNADLKKHPDPNGKVKVINNILLPLVEDGYTDSLKRSIISSLRKNWTLATYKMNRLRPSGSISPAYPDLDAKSILGVPTLLPPTAKKSLQYGPTEPVGAGTLDDMVKASETQIP